MAETFPVQGLAQRCGQLAYGRHADFASGGMELSQKEMTMPKMTAKNRARIAAVKAKATHARILQARRTKTPEIPDKFLRQLAAFNLPPIKFVYDACLEKLMRETDGMAQ